MRNITKTGYEALTIIRSMNDPTIGFGLDISPALWINECKDTKFFVFAPQGCINQIYELSDSLNDYIDGIITPCGNILPINNKIEFLESEGIGLECVEGKLKFIIKAPLDPSLGGTGFITYNDGDILLGNQDGKLSILLKGEIGQVLGVKPDGTVGFITSSASEGINEIITPCGRLKPIDGAIKLTMGEGLETTCTGEELTTKLKVPVPSNFGGTGIQQYNKGDLLIGKDDGSLEKLPKGTSGQVLGIKSDGTLGYINSSINNFPKCTAYLISNTSDVIGDENIYFLGSTDTAFSITSQIGDGFYTGNANGNPASYTCKENGDYLFNLNTLYKVKFITPNPGGGYIRVFFTHYDIYNNVLAMYESIRNISGSEAISDYTISVSKSIIMYINQSVKFSVQALRSNKRRSISILGKENKQIGTYIDIYKIR